MSFSSIDAIFNGLSVTDLYTQGNYPRENNAKMTQWKLYIIQLEEMLYAREGHYRFIYVFFLGELNKNHS